VLGIRRGEQVEELVARPVGRVVRRERRERAGPPPCLLEHLTRGRGDRRLARLDLPGRDLPAPRVGDEPVPPQQQHAALRVVHDDAGGLVGHVHHVVLEPVAAGDLDVGEAARTPSRSRRAIARRAPSTA
jgi:hypothetical protein